MAVRLKVGACRTTPQGGGQYTPGPLQFITASTYRRAPIFLSEPFCRCLVEAWADAREGLGRPTL